MKCFVFYRTFALMMLLLMGALSMYGASDRYYWHNGLYYTGPDYNPDRTVTLLAAPDGSYLHLSGVVTIPETITVMDSINGVLQERTFTVKEIAAETFKNCVDITEIKLPNTCYIVRSGAFEGCSGLTRVNLSDRSTGIANRLFYGCSSLTEINIPQNVQTVQDSAFYNCSALATVNWNAKNCLSTNTWDFSSVTQVNYGDMVENLPQHFMKNARISTLELPLSLKRINYGCFKNCANLTEVVIPDSVNFIAWTSFDSCTAVTSVTMGRSVTEIWSSIFGGCKNITKIYWNATHCRNAGAIVKGDMQPEIIFADDVEILPKGLYNNTSIQELQVPSSIKVLASYCLSECNQLKNLALPDGLVTIEDHAFYSSNGLRSLTIPNTVKTIGDNAFLYMRNLTDLTLSNTLDSVGSHIIYECTNLDHLVIPKSLRAMGENAFSTARINTITVEEGNPFLDSRDNCNAIIETATNVLLKGSIATVIPDGITAIGDYAFDMCNGLIDNTIPEGVRTIGYAAYYRVWNMDTVILPSTLDTIRARAFYYTPGMRYLICKAVVPPVVENEDAFDWWHNENMILFVPAESVDAYHQADVWKKFNAIIPIGTVINPGDVNNDGSIDIKDVTAIIDILLEGDFYYHPNMDTNYDDVIDIKDMTILIDMILWGMGE